MWERLYALQTAPSGFLHAELYSAWTRSTWGRGALQYIAHADDGLPLGSWFLSTRSRHRFFAKSTTAWLNADGGSSSDTPFIEHNNLLTAPGHESEVLELFISTIKDSDIDRLIIAGAESEFANVICQQLNDWHSVRDAWPCPYVDLRTVRESSDGYLGLLGSNTRYSIRRAARQFKAYGSPQLQVATSTTEAMEWYRELVDLHEQRWGERGQTGAFASAERRLMHEHLLAFGSPGRLTHIVRARYGQTTIGLLLCLISGGRVLFYQSGINYSSEQRAHPGLLLHAMAIQHFADLGYREYDFLASPEGKDKYKHALATNTRSLEWVTLVRPSLQRTIWRTSTAGARWIKNLLVSGRRLLNETAAPQDIP